MLRTAFWFFIGGLLVAMTLALTWWAVGPYSHASYSIEKLSLFLWPTCIFLMATDGFEKSKFIIVFALTFSLLANGLLYGILGLFVGAAKEFLASRKKK